MGVGNPIDVAGTLANGAEEMFPRLPDDFWAGQFLDQSLARRVDNSLA
jgi:hypothetical protein